MPHGPNHANGDKICARPGCDAWFPNHYWGKVKAHSAGWFGSAQTQTYWCPDHNPEWVAAWRAKKEK
jgi:hypothetical protein